jgi:hypothetical protein
MDPADCQLNIHLVYAGIRRMTDWIFSWCVQGSGGLLTEYSFGVWIGQADFRLNIHSVYTGFRWIANWIFGWCVQGSGGLLTRQSFGVCTGSVTNMDLALPRMCWTMDLQGPTGHMAACDQTQTKRTSQDPGWWPITRWHHSFPSFIEAPCASPPSLIKSPRRLPQDPAGIPPRFYWGIPPRVMILEDLMALVLRTKSIGQWPLTLVDRTF